MTNNPKFAVGSNVPGYMPDSDPHHATWAECKACLVADLRWHLDTFSDGLSADDVTDYEEAIRRAEALTHGREFGQTVAHRHYWLTRI